MEPGCLAGIALHSLVWHSSRASGETQARVHGAPHYTGAPAALCWSRWRMGLRALPSLILPSRMTLPGLTHWLQWFAELVPVVGRRFSYSFRYIWQGSGRILDTTPDSSAKDLQEVVDFNVQVPGDSNNVRGRPESCGHPILEKKKRNRLPNGRTRSFRGLACSFSCPLPDRPARSTLGSWKCLLTAFHSLGRIRILGAGRTLLSIYWICLPQIQSLRALVLGEFIFNPHPLSLPVSPFCG